jgi:hypothetical protein
VVARVFEPPYFAVHSCRHELVFERLAQQQMVDAQPGIALPAIASVVPERKHRRVGRQLDGAARSGCSATWSCTSSRSCGVRCASSHRAAATARCPAGLIAALYLRRNYRKVVIADATPAARRQSSVAIVSRGSPDGIPGHELLGRLRAQLTAQQGG